MEIKSLDLRNRKLVMQAAEIFVKRFGAGSFYNDPWDVESVVKNVFAENNKKKDGKLFVAIKDGQVIAVAGSHAFGAFMHEWGHKHLPEEHRTKFKPFGKIYYLDFIAVHPDHENQGIGRKLAEARHEYGKRLGYDSVALRTIHPAREKLARSMGYKMLFEHSGSGRVASSTITQRKYFARRL